MNNGQYRGKSLMKTASRWLSGMRNPLWGRKANRAAALDVGGSRDAWGGGPQWAKPAYGGYYATSVAIHAAIRTRTEALSRQRLLALHNDLPVPDHHPVQMLLDRANRWTTRGQLWTAIETNLCLWGSAFLALEPDDAGRMEIWVLRSDRMKVIPDRERHIRGYVYVGANGAVPYTADEIVWLRYYNPLDEFSGLSPIAPLRLSLDMGMDALKFNRSFYQNSARPDLILTTETNLSEQEVTDFYQRWESRYQGPSNAHRPAIASFIKDVKPIGFSQREMEFVQGLRWSLEDVSRIYGVPLPLLSDYQRATFTNIRTAEQLFWRNTMIPEMRFIEEQLDHKLLHQLGYPEIKLRFETDNIEALRQDEDSLAKRQSMLLDRGVLTINEVRRSRNLPDVPWGDGPSQSGE